MKNAAVFAFVALTIVSSPRSASVGDFAPISVGETWRYAYAYDNAWIGYPEEFDHHTTSLRIASVARRGDSTFVSVEVTDSGIAAHNLMASSHDTLDTVRTWVQRLVGVGNGIFPLNGSTFLPLDIPPRQSDTNQSAPGYTFLPPWHSREIANAQTSVIDGEKRYLYSEHGPDQLVLDYAFATGLGLIRYYSWYATHHSRVTTITLTEHNGHKIDSAEINKAWTVDIQPPRSEPRRVGRIYSGLGTPAAGGALWLIDGRMRPGDRAARGAWVLSPKTP